MLSKKASMHVEGFMKHKFIKSMKSTDPRVNGSSYYDLIIFTLYRYMILFSISFISVETLNFCIK